MTHDDAPLLADLLPWSVAPVRLGRAWPMAPEAASLKARWEALVRAGEQERAALFGPSRSRTVRSAVAQLPGQATGTGRLAREPGPFPVPVRVLHGPFDEQWLIPDHRLIDAARPELWRVADAGQLFAVEQGQVPGPAAGTGAGAGSSAEPATGSAGAASAGSSTHASTGSSGGPDSGPVLLVTALLPEGRSPAGRPGRIRPLFRRPGGREPNLAPGLLGHLAGRLGTAPSPVDVLAWSLATARPGRAGPSVPLTADPALWARGTDLGRRMLELMVRGGDRPKLPGGRRPYVRVPLPPRPAEFGYDRDEEVLRLDDGVIAPVAPEAWDFRVSGVRVLELWLARRTSPAEPGTLQALGPPAWPQTRTSELLELVAVLALLAALRPLQDELHAELLTDSAARIGTTELRRAGVLPVAGAARRPASVLDHHEEGPEGQFALL